MATATAVSFVPDRFEPLHRGPVARLVSATEVVPDAFEELQQHRQALASPFAFRGREETLDLPQVAQHLLAHHPRLATEPVARAVDEVSRSLRLHQHDCCALMESMLNASGSLVDLPRQCAAAYYRECHFQALCLYDLAQGLAEKPPNKHSVAFFGLIGGRRCATGIFEALSATLRELSGERANDQLFLAHAAAVIQLLVETLLAYYAAFQGSPEEAEQLLALLPHVVVAQHAPLGTGLTVSDLDLVLREEHADVSIKLCLMLFYICLPTGATGSYKLDATKIVEDADPARLHLQDLAAPAGEGVLAPSTGLGGKVRSGTFWNEESQLGQFLCFALSGVILDDERALREGYVRWHILHFLLHEVLLSSSLVCNTWTSKLVLRAVHVLLAKAFLPVGRRWVAYKKLEAQAVTYRYVAPDALQIAALQAISRLCRVYPPSCEDFKELALHCTDVFHLSVAQSPQQLAGQGAGMLPVPQAYGQADSAGLLAPLAGAALWLGAPPNPAGMLAPTQLAARHDSTSLYVKILDFLASVCARGRLQTTRQVCQKLMSHSNQWFNYGFLLDLLARHSTTHCGGLAGYARGAAPQHGVEATTVAVALCHLFSGTSGSRLWVCRPPPQATAQALEGAGSSLGSRLAIGSLGSVLQQLLLAHPEAHVKAACLGALSQLDLSPNDVRHAFHSLVTSLPTLLAYVSDVRSSCDGAVAIELLSCALRLAQSLPAGEGRYCLDLQPVTHVVIHHILLKLLSDPSQFYGPPRFWRLAALALRWLRLVLRGPMPVGSSGALNQALIGPYAATESQAQEAARRSSNGNATAYAFRCLLVLDSPVFARVMYLSLLRGSIDALSSARKGGAAQPYMEQAAHVGLDVVRVLLQRDVLFRELYNRYALERATAGLPPIAGGAEEGGLLLAHQALLSEFAFSYPPAADDPWGQPTAANPFEGRRLWQGPTGGDSRAGAGGRNTNPSYFSLLLEYIGARSNPDICRLALFAFAQCALREPARVLRMVRLEAWRLEALTVDLYECLMQPTDEPADAMSSAASQPASRSSWDRRAEEVFAFEAAEMDSPVDGHLDVASFKTGLPLCHSADLSEQIEDDAVAQISDLLAWSSRVEGQGLGSRAASAYCTALALQAPCRLLALRSLALLLGGAAYGDSARDGPRLAQLLLGLDPDETGPGREIDMDPRRTSAPVPLDAVLTLLENPPPLPVRPISARLTGHELPTLAPRHQHLDLGETLQQHASYEAALTVLLCLLGAAPIQDVALRYVCHAWTSRYSVLRDLLALPWPSAPPALRRLLLSETALLLQVACWEMRLIWPAGSPPPDAAADALTVAGQQRADMKSHVSEYLQEVVRSFLVSSPASGAAPSLVAAALRLTAAGVEEPSGWNRAADGSKGALLNAETRELLMAAACPWLEHVEVPQAGLDFKVQLLDPSPTLRHAIDRALLAAGHSGLTFGPDGLGGLEMAEAIVSLTKVQEESCPAAYVGAACRSLELFALAALHHLTGAAAPVNGLAAQAAEAVAQTCRTHLEALLPPLVEAAESSSVVSVPVGGARQLALASVRAELLASLAVTFLDGAIGTRKSPPVTYARAVFEHLKRAAVGYPSSRRTQQKLQEALSLTILRLLPEQDMTLKLKAVALQQPPFAVWVEVLRGPEFPGL